MKVCEGGVTSVDSSQGEDCGLEWHSAGDGVKTDNDSEHSQTVAMAKTDEFFVGAVGQVLFRKRKVAWG